MLAMVVPRRPGLVLAYATALWLISQNAGSGYWRPADSYRDIPSYPWPPNRGSLSYRLDYSAGDGGPCGRLPWSDRGD